MGYTNRNHSHSLCLIVYDGLLQEAFCMILKKLIYSFFDLKLGGGEGSVVVLGKSKVPSTV